MKPQPQLVAALDAIKRLDKPVKKDKPVEHVFLYNMIDIGNCPINPSPLEVSAKCLGHALQKIAAQLSDNCTEVVVWKS